MEKAPYQEFHGQNGILSEGPECGHTNKDLHLAERQTLLTCLLVYGII
jgi:hypothetical protein